MTGSKLIKKFIFALCFHLIYFGLAAQNYNYPIDNFTQKNYGRQFEATNYAITQDLRGVMYFGNANGVLGYDGKNWDFIPVKTGTWINALCTAPDGTIYIGADMEFGFLSPNPKGELIYHSISDSLPNDAPFYNSIYKVYVLGESVFFQSYEAIFVYKNKKISIIKPEHSFHLSFQIDNKIYLREREKGLSIIDPKHDDLQPKLVKGGEYYRDIGISSILLKSNNHLCIVTFNNGIFDFDPVTGESLKMDEPPLLANIQKYGAIKLFDGNIAINSVFDGLIIVNENLNVIKTINELDGLNSNDIKYTFEDKFQNLWLALNNGISKIDYSSAFSYFTENYDLNFDVYCISAYDSNLYLGTSAGLYQMNSQNAQAVFKKFGEFQSQVWEIKNVGNEMLVATSDGLYAFDGNSFYKIINKPVRTICYDPVINLLFLGDQSYLSVYQKQINWTEVLMVEEVFENIIKIEKFDKKSNQDYSEIWLGTQQEGCLKLTIDRSLSYNLSYYDELSGLPANFVLPFKIGDSILFATQNGFLRFVDESEMKKALPDSLKNDEKFYQGTFELANIEGNNYNVFASYLLDVNPNTYLIYNDNINILNQNNLNNQTFRALDMGKLHSLYEYDQKLWIGTVDGLAVYNLIDHKNYETAGKTIIRKINLNNTIKLFNGNHFKGDTNSILEFSQFQNDRYIPIIGYDQNDISFEFASAFFDHNDKTEFSFLLEGFSDKWSEWSTETKAVFTNLKEGDYSFHVKSRNIYGVESEADTYSFTILPPWYRTIYAIIAYFIFAMLLIYISIKLGQRQLKRRNEYLEKVVQERTLEIREEKEKSEKLLLNTLPVKVVEDLKSKGVSEPENFQEVTVYFSDVVGFTNMSSSLEPRKLIEELNDIFTAFDDIMYSHNCERIKTIGDAYMAVCGMPEPNEKHAENMMKASLEILEYLKGRNKTTELQWNIRIGLNSGPVVGGIVGVKKYIYDVFGDTINTASRMESNSEPMRINVSQATYQLLHDQFSFQSRDPLEVKGKGMMKMWFVKN